MSSVPDDFENVPLPDPGSQGGKAVRAWTMLMRATEALFTAAGLHCDRHSRTLACFRNALPGGLLGNGFFARRVLVGQCHYEKELRLPFVVWRRGWPAPLGIDFQSQNNGGSTDDKIFKTANDLHLAECASVFVLTGSDIQAHGNIIECVRRVQAQCPDRFLRLFVGDTEFREWITTGMEWPGGGQNNLL